MNVFWVFVPGAVILTAGLIVFEWRNRKHQLTKETADESESQA